MNRHDPADSASGAPDTDGSRGGRMRGAVAAGTEILISVLAALAFFVIFLGALAVIMPTAVTVRDAVAPAEFGGGQGFSGSLDDLSNLSDRLNPTAALLTVLNTTVMRKPADGIAWGTVPSGTELLEGDAVQTTRDGTALLTFGRGKRLELEQNSLLIVRASHATSGSGGKAAGASVHVLLGELWGNVAREGSERPSVDVTAPGAEAHVAGPGGAGAAQFRLAVHDDKTSVLSVYRGSADVVVRGQTVRVAANQYVAMDSVRGIGTPAALPAMPTLLAPDVGATFRYREMAPSVQFRWGSVAGVDGYRLLISRNADFQGVVIDQRLTATSFTYGNWSRGSYYWRVSALRAGAESPPSPPRTVIVSSVMVPPLLTVRFPAVVDADHVMLSGESEGGVRVLVAGEPAAIDRSGHWSAVVRLKRGFNVVVVEAIDKVGNTAYQSKVLEAKY